MTSLIGEIVRSVQAAAPVPYVGRAQSLFGKLTDRTNRTAQLDTASASATVFSIVSRCSTAVARVQWHMHQKLTDRGAVCGYDDCDATGVRWVEKHPALTVLERPNAFYTRGELFEAGQQHVDLTGEGYLVIDRVGTLPAELWVVRPDRMTVVADRRDFLLGWIYADPDGQEIPLRREDVLQLRMPHPKDPYRGLGPVQSVMPEVEGGAVSAEYNLAFFRNGAQPGGVVKIRANMSDTAFDQLVERWEETHGGVHNAGRVAFLEEGEYTPVTPLSMKDMQFTEGANLRRDTIMLAFGASKFDLGILEDVNRASSEAARADFAERMTVPRLDRWAGMLNNDFLPQFSGLGPAEGYSIVYTSPVPADREADRQDKSAAVVNFVALVGAGVDATEAAEVCGLPPMTVTRPEPRPIERPRDEQDREPEEVAA